MYTLFNQWSRKLIVLKVFVMNVDLCCVATFYWPASVKWFDRHGIVVDKDLWENGISKDSVSHICELLFDNRKYIVVVVDSRSSKLNSVIYESLSDIIRCFNVLAAYKIVTHHAPIIVYKLIIVWNE